MRIITRLLSFPFVVGLSFIAFLRMWFVFMYDYIVHGGEMIAYDKIVNRKTIYDTYEIIQEILKDEKS